MVWAEIFLPSLGFLLAIFKKPTRLFLAGFLFFVFSSSALPWSVIPVSGVETGVLYLFMFGVLYLHMAQGKQQNKKQQNTIRLQGYLTTLILFGLLLLVYTPLSNTPSYGWLKTELFFLESIVPLVVFSIVLRQGDFSLLYWVLIGSSLLASLVLVSGLGQAGLSGDRVAIGDDSPITAGRTIGFGAVLLLTTLLFGLKGKWGRQLLCLVVGGALLVAVLVTGSRGPLLGIGVTIACIALLAPRVRIWAKLLTVGALVYLLFLGVGQSSKIQALPSYDRLVTYTQNMGTNTSDQGRIDRLHYAWQSFWDSNGVGVGTGGFSGVYGTDQRDYPHNIALEVLCEQGIVGFVFLLLLLVPTTLRVGRICRDKGIDNKMKSISALFLYAVFNAMVSGDIATNSIVWLFGGIVWLIPLSAKMRGAK